MSLTVAGEARRPWRQGRAVLFDDSYEHAVEHGGDRDRIVLDLSIDHPGLRSGDRGDLRR